MILRIIQVILFVILAATVCLAQYPSYRHFTVNDGLAQMQINCLYQDSRGYLWIGTKGGVSKYNGESFENLEKKDGLIQNEIIQIVEDEESNIWFANRKGLCRYNGERIESFPINNDTYFRHLVFDKDNNLCAIYNDYVYCFDGLNFQRLLNYPVKFIHDYSSYYKGFLADIESRGICLITKDTVKELPDLNLDFRQKEIYNSSYNAMLKKVIYRPQKWHTNDYILHGKKLSKIWEKNYKTFEIANVNFELLNTNFFYPSKGQLMMLNKQEQVIEVISTFSYDYMKTFLLDNKKNIWIGTEEGLVLLFSNNAFKHYNAEPFSYIWSMVDDPPNGIWLAGHKKPLKLLTNRDSIKSVSINSVNGDGFYNGALKDKKGNILFPMSPDILKYENRKFTILESRGITKSANLILFEDKDRELILSGVEGGINIFKDYQKIKYIGEKDGIHPCGYIVSIGKDRQGQYWLGSFRGLSRFNIETGNAINYTKLNKRLPFDGVISILQDHKGKMWLGGTSGLAVYDYKRDSIVAIATDVIENQVNSLMCFDSTHLFLGVLDGLYILDLVSYYNSGVVNIKYYNHRNGYLGIEPTQNTIIKDSEGFIWIASATSIDRIDPKKLDLTVKPLNTVITRINREKYPFNSKQIELPYGENNIEFRYEAVGLDRPFLTQYSLRLIKEGNETEWSTWQLEDFVTYQNLSSGNYIFEVRSRQGGQSETTSQTASIPIKIRLEWWKEPDFYETAFYIFLAFGFFTTILGFLGVKARINARKREKEQRDEKRKSQYLETQAVIEQTKFHITFNALFSLQNIILNKDWQKAQDYLVLLSKFIRRFLEASISSDVSNIGKYNDEFTLEQEIQLLQSYIDLQHKLYNGSFTYKIESNNIDAANYDLPPMLIQPIVENAILHGLNQKEDGEKLLLVEFNLDQNDNLICTVEDTGIGIKEAKRRKEEKQSIQFKPYKSQGTNLINKRKELLKEIGYNVSFSSVEREGGGTIVTIKISSNYED